MTGKEKSYGFGYRWKLEDKTRSEYLRRGLTRLQLTQLETNNVKPFHILLVRLLVETEQIAAARKHRCVHLRMKRKMKIYFMDWVETVADIL